MNRFKLLAVLSALVVTMVSAAGMGSQAAAGTKDTPKGTPIKIGMMSPINSQTISLPDAYRAAQIAEKAINDAGGVKGRPLQLVHCDDQDNPSQASLCARQLLEDEDVLFTTASFGRQMAALYPVLEATDKINLFSVPVVPEDFSNPRSYPIGPGSQALASFGALVNPKKIKKVAVVRPDTANGKFTYTLTAPAFEAKGIEVVDIPVDPTATDLQPTALRIQQEDVDAVVLGTTTTAAVQLIRAATALGQKPTWLTYSGQLSPQAIQDLSSTDANPIVALGYAIDPKLPRAAEFNREMKKYGKKSGIEDTDSDTVKNAWLAVHLAAEVLEDIDKADPASVRSYIDEQTKFETGMTHPINFTEPVNPAFPRLFNKWVVPGAIRNGKLVQTSNKWVSGS